MPTTVQNVIELLSLIVIFIIVLVVCYFTTKFVAGRQLVQKKVGNFEVIETFPLAPNKYLQLIKMGKKYIVISVSKDTITYIVELKEEEVCQVQKNSTTMAGKNFKEVLSGFLKDNPEKKSLDYKK